MQVFIILGGGWLASKLRTKGLVIAGIAMIAAVGTILLITVSREQKGVLLFGYYLVSPHQFNPGVVLSGVNKCHVCRRYPVSRESHL